MIHSKTKEKTTITCSIVDSHVLQLVELTKGSVTTAGNPSNIILTVQ